MIGSRTYEMDLLDHDVMLLHVSAPNTVRLTLEARIGQHWQVVFHQIRGTDQCDEFSGPITPGILRELRLTLCADSPAAAHVGLTFIMVHQAGRLEHMLAKPSPYTPDWPGKLHPAAPDEMRPITHLFFDDKGLEALRVKAEHKSWAPVLERFRESAHHLHEWNPETEICEDAPGNHGPRYVRPRNIKHRGLRDVTLAAFISLLDRDPELARIVCRAVMSACHWPHWSWSFMNRFPGSAWNTRCFAEAGVANVCSVALDWAGAALTPHGREVVCHNLWMKGLAPIELDFQNRAYIRTMNQGIVFSQGRILATLSLMRCWPHAGEMLPVMERDLKEMIEAYVLPDGGTDEGIGYWFYTFNTILPVMAALARREGVTLRDYLPPVLRIASDFLQTLLSTTGEIGTGIPIGDAHTGALGATPFLLLGAAGDSAAGALGATMAASSPERCGVFDFIYGPEERAPVPIVFKPFLRLSQCGYLASRRPDSQFCEVKFLLVGGKINASHAHQDRGSFVLEAGGDILAMDRGVTHYGHPATGLMKRAHLHNVLIPVRTDGMFAQQLQPFSYAVIPEGRGDAQTLEASVDCTAAWPDDFKQSVRSVESPDPRSFLIRDRVECLRQQAVEFRLHSAHPIRQDGNHLRVVGPHATLCIRPEWDLTTVDVAQEGLDEHGQPVWRLALRSQAAVAHDLLTHLTLLPTSAIKVPTVDLTTRIDHHGPG
jgi:hypothetical protein